MRQEKHANALLLELLIVIFFFMLASTTLVRIFGEARRESLRSEIRSEAMQQAQNLSDSLYLTEAYSTLLEEAGYKTDENVWTLCRDGWRITVVPEEKEMSAGKLIYWNIQAVVEDELLFTLPGARYWSEVKLP